MNSIRYLEKEVISRMTSFLSLPGDIHRYIAKIHPRTIATLSAVNKLLRNHMNPIYVSILGSIQISNTEFQHYINSLGGERLQQGKVPRYLLPKYVIMYSVDNIYCSIVSDLRVKKVIHTVGTDDEKKNILVAGSTYTGGPPTLMPDQELNFSTAQAIRGRRIGCIWRDPKYLSRFELLDDPNDRVGTYLRCHYDMLVQGRCREMDCLLSRTGPVSRNLESEIYWYFYGR